MKVIGYLLILGVLAGTAVVAKTTPGFFNALAFLQVAGLGIAAMLAAYGVKRPMDGLVALFAPDAKIGRGELESARRVFTGMAQLMVVAGLVVALLVVAGAEGRGMAAAARLAMPAVFFGLVLGGLVCWPLALSMAVRAGDMSSARRFEYDRGHDRDRQQSQPRRDQRPAQPLNQNSQPKPGGSQTQPQRGGGQPNQQPRQQPRGDGGSGQPGGGEPREGRERGGRNRRNRFRDRHERERQPGGQPAAAGGEARPATAAPAFVAESLDENRPAPVSIPAPDANAAAAKPAAPAGGVSSLLTSTTGTEL